MKLYFALTGFVLVARFASHVSAGISFKGPPPSSFPLDACKTSEGWVEYEGHCYKMVYDFNGMPSDIQEIYDICQAQGPQTLYGDFAAHLADITSQAENDFVTDVVTQGERAWLGAYQEESSPGSPCLWVLQDFSITRPLTYTNWKKGEPNDAFGDEDCIEINRGSQPGAWNDIKCTRKRPGVCKYRIADLSSSQNQKP